MVTYFLVLFANVHYVEKDGAPIIIPDGDSSEASSYTSRNSQNYTHSQSSPQALSVSVYRRVSEYNVCRFEQYSEKKRRTLMYCL